MSEDGFVLQARVEARLVTLEAQVDLLRSHCFGREGETVESVLLRAGRELLCVAEDLARLKLYDEAARLHALGTRYMTESGSGPPERDA